MSKGKDRRVAQFHGIVERFLFTLIAIPFMKPELNTRLPDTTGVGLLITAAALYLTLRERNPDVLGPGLSVYSLWGMAVSTGLGIFGGWVFWAV
jgi:hypothetical protein